MRRTIVGVIITFALGCLCVPLTAGAQPPGRVHRIGWLSAGSPPSAPGLTIPARLLFQADAVIQ